MLLHFSDNMCIKIMQLDAVSLAYHKLIWIFSEMKIWIDHGHNKISRDAKCTLCCTRPSAAVYNRYMASRRKQSSHNLHKAARNCYAPQNQQLFLKYRGCKMITYSESTMYHDKQHKAQMKILTHGVPIHIFSLQTTGLVVHLYTWKYIQLVC